MKRAIIEALTYPRIVMMSQIDAESCPMHLYFNASLRACRHCDQASECRWLNDNDNFMLLAEQPLERLHQAFLFCIDYVETRVTLDQHNLRHCVCESCEWLRESRHLARQYDGFAEKESA